MSNLSDLLNVFVRHEKNATKEGVIDLLSKLNTGGVSAYVAGGWLRDIDNGIIPKDADIFVCPSYQVEVPCEVIYAVTRDFEPGVVRTFHPNYEGGQMREDVDYVIKYGKSYDVVVMKSNIEDVIRNFDVSICQIYGYFNGDDIKVRVSNEYLEYKKNNVIFQYVNVKTTDDHTNRIKSKFPHATYIDHYNYDISFVDLPYDLWDNASQ